MSHPFTPSSIPFVPIPISSSGHTPPYTSDEDEFHKKCDPRNRSVPTARNVLQHIMATNQTFSAYQDVMSPKHIQPTIPITVPLMSSQSNLPPTTNFSFSPPGVCASLRPSARSKKDHAPESPTQPSSFASSSEWQNTDNESRFSMDTEVEPSSVADSGLLSSSSLLSSSQNKNKSQVIVPRPPNAWILYRSDMLKKISEGEKVPGIDKAREELGLSPLHVDGSCDEGSGNKSMPPPPVKKVKIRKGGKMPTEDFIALGPGKGGKGLPQSDISKVISHLWKNEVPEIRVVYENKANARKLEHRKLYPDYKFQPKRKAEKLKQRVEREREKQEARRLREEEKRAGKAKRRSRNREKRSPISIYGTTPARHETPYLGRTLTYDSESSGIYPSSFETSNMSDLPATAAQAAFRRPFPLPNYAVPALPAAGEPSSSTPGQAVAHDYIWRHTRHTGPLMMNDLDLLVPPRTEQYSSDSFSAPSEPLTAPASPGQPLSLDSANYDAPLPATASSSPEGSVSDEDFQRALLSITSAAHDISHRPIAVLDIDDIPVLGDERFDIHEDPAALAQAWWDLDQDVSENDTASQPSKCGLIADDQTLNATALEAESFLGSSSNLISVAIGEPFHQHGALDATDHEAEASQLPSMIEGVTYQSLETIYQQPVYYTPVFDSNSFFLGMTPVFEPALFEQAPSPFDQGPFLSTVQPLSPTETYSAEPTPRESTFLQAGQDSNCISSSSSREGTGRTVSSTNIAPRYISSSAYPPTPSSMDTTGLPSVTGIVDRNTSFSALTAVLAGQGMSMMGEDMLAWDEDESAAEYAAANASVIVDENRKQRENALVVSLEPVGGANSPTNPSGLDPE
ncbi:hypothetical protein C343_06408 [Cryptococcus neoformans C23]|uniref:HMG box domain-containing protein n=1 Tax=Cryptococcus neoformans (strain H99 / ATCC 208821 / CBS 10515 / FGSC 9487) TaxID=235443 RepID=J9W2T0_CRYN9|nr:hypothetical protein CNAG_06203 [Cryptococcus neoformans var. grubii H99]XP_012053200.1 hypothetical protein, variant [Cryptococcus neoformans var. grubii H99]AUB28576.1 hypothetical protein CKF44_06203 [Cryptococcus neoformans var. grubii]OWZ27237.1 hypothetical protein C347_06407 [Cryptococcus neoformans var. grubii AD2-60a]OWZ39200.1 hypothetical protein C343_06408 [Cryptococcus neoformans var. grubii C23]OXC81392.1 hypothetical protein C344_06312 [Cryptococcus neoformans var. grubii AD1|eukprot:XP_012053047.1 hypothetical protein CNAG_06203 [Cryptococcus neoformans var. grubii H99]